MSRMQPKDSARPFRFSELFPSTRDRESLPEMQRYVARDGSALPFRHYAADCQVALVLLHGSAADGAYLHAFAKAISHRSLANVYIPDLRGHGQKPERRGDINYIGQLEDDLADLLAHIRSSVGKETTVIVGGHSSGGGLALRFGGGPYGHLADSFLLLAPYLGHNAPALKRNSGGWVSPRMWRIIPIAMLNALGLRMFNAVKVLRFNLPPEFQTGTETLEYSFRLMTGFNPVNYRAEFSAIKLPVMVLIGAEDEAFRANEVELAIRPYKPDVEIKVISGVSHLGLVMCDRAVSEVANWISAAAWRRPN